MPVYPGRRTGTHRVTVWSHGKQNEWIVEGTKREATTFEATKRLELRAMPVATTRGTPSFSTFAASYSVHAAARLGKATWGSVRKYQVATLIAHFGPTKVDALTQAQIEAFKTKRLASGNVASSVNNELRVLGTMLTWGREVLGLPIAISKIAKLRTERPRVTAWTPSEVSALYNAISVVAPELMTLAIFMLNTGVRKGEAIAAEWGWLDVRSRMLRIPVTAHWKPKDAQAREVPLEAWLLGAMRTYRATSGHERWIFPTLHGERRKTFPQKLFKRAVKKAKLVGSPHKTRHTFASTFLAGNPDLGLLANLLGHSQTTVTERYAHMLPDHLERARGVVSLRPPSKAWRPTLAKKVSSRDR